MVRKKGSKFSTDGVGQAIVYPEVSIVYVLSSLRAFSLVWNGTFAQVVLAMAAHLDASSLLTCGSTGRE